MKKFKKNGGFTLIEMLIVVAIIAILVAVSIPLINGALERARDATDQANERAAKAEATLIYMGTVAEADPNHPDFDDYKALLDDLTDTDTGAYYDAANGCLLTEEPETAYGQCTDCGSDYAENGASPGDHRGCVINIAIDPEATGISGDVEEMFVITWEKITD